MTLQLTNHDLELQNGSLRLADDTTQGVAQRIQQRLLMVKGEWFLDTEFGTDYPGIVWDKQVPAQVRDAHLKQQMLLAAGEGAEILSFESTFASTSRLLTVAAEIQLASGETVSVEA